MKKTNFLFISLVFLAVTACQPKQAKVDYNAILEEFKKIEAEWPEANRERDVDKYMSFLAPNATIMNEGEPVITNNDDYRKSLEKSFKDSTYLWETFTWKKEQIDISETGDIVILRGYYSMQIATPEGNIKVNGKGLDIFKKINGEYKSFISIFNSDM